MRIEVFGQDLLWERRVGPDLFLESLLMSLHGCLTWGDNGLEAESLPITSFSCLRVAHGELVDVAG